MIFLIKIIDIINKIIKINNNNNKIKNYVWIIFGEFGNGIFLKGFFRKFIKYN